MKKDLIKEEFDIDKGVTIDPRDFEVTDELIAKIERNAKMSEVLWDDSFKMMKKVKQFQELSERELFKLRKRGLKRSYKKNRWLLNDVRCVRPSKT